MKKLILLLITVVTTISLQGQKRQTVTLKNYLKNHKLDHITKVEANKSVLTLYGYKDLDNDALLTRKVKLSRYEVLADWDFSWFLKRAHYNTTSISLTTVPFKVRPRFEEFNSFATSGITNFGFNFDLARISIDRYFATGKKSNHKFYAGIWIAPSVEELDSISTRGALSAGNTNKKLFISTALTINYTYNNLTFTFVPVGIDFATSALGKKWVYNKRRWWGFGIGIEPKFFNKLAN